MKMKSLPVTLALSLTAATLHATPVSSPPPGSATRHAVIETLRAHYYEEEEEQVNFLILELRADQGGAVIVAEPLQADKFLPKSRGCALSYWIDHTYVYGDYVVVVIGMNREARYSAGTMESDYLYVGGTLEN